jgi:3-hydroxyisobutyrate dehydrogenase-like beta-hydroxyacid dehydrogenase
VSAPARIGLIGLGEVGTVLADDLARPGAALSAWDLKFDDQTSPPSRAAAARPLLRRGRDAADAVRDCELVISAVTAAQTVAAAKAAAAALAPGAFYLDLNSSSPAAKIEAAALLAARGGRYVEAAVMSPISPRRLASPILMGGPEAEAFLPVARALGFTGASRFSAEYGQAAAAKLCRSVVVKGLEALLLESLIAARHYGVERAVLRSLDGLAGPNDWSEMALYMLSRAIQHGSRRAEEMRAAAETVGDAGLVPLMSAACAERQEWAAGSAPLHHERDLDALLDALRARIGARGKETSRP